MELTKISDLIQERINLLKKGRKELKQRAERKAETSAYYDKQLSITLISLKNGKEYHWEGEPIKNPPTTIAEKVAKGMLWREKLEMEKAEQFYRNAVLGMSSLEAEMNALQSLLKFQNEM